jgi:hypothetical protein
MSKRGQIPFDPEIGPDEESDIDWHRHALAVTSRASDPGGANRSPVGDATRWGGESRVHMNAVQGGGLTRANQPQIVRADSNDLFARNWQLIGTVDASNLLWDADPDDILWQAAIQIYMGAGQVTLVHQLDLKELCQLALNSGVYVVQRNGPFGDAGRQIRSWVMTGGIVGKAVNVTVLNGLASFAPGGPATLSEDVRISMALAPIMAGTGI